jgi:hypothetical protein
LARQWSIEHARALLFFHGPGLEHARPGNRSDFATLAGNDLTLCVCRAGWQRLKCGEPPPPFFEGSLVQFWDAALAAETMRSFGALRDE